MSSAADWRTRSLEGQVVLVTGGNSGIGLSLAMGVARAGADVVIWGRDAERNESARRQIAQLGSRCIAAMCDVTVEGEVISRLGEAVEQLGRLDAVFANAGAAPEPKRFTELSLEEWRASLSNNLDAGFLCLREGAKHLVNQGTGGALVATASLAAINGTPWMQSYAAAKAGLCALIRGLAVELARHGIRANALAPGWFDTPLTAGAKSTPALYEHSLKRIPQRRWAAPVELERVAVFLADKTITLHTGETVVVDGGYSIA